MPSYIPPLNPVNPDDVRRALNFGTATLLDVGMGADDVAPGNVVSGIAAAYNLANTAISAITVVSGSTHVAQVTANSAVSGVATTFAIASTALTESNQNTIGLNVVTTKTITKVSPIRRGPGSSDDLTVGYATLVANGSKFANRWNFDDKAWLCNQNVAGFGAWVPNPLAFGYPGSSISETAPLFMGGTRRMVAGYTGPALNVINPLSGANKDISYLDNDDDVDETALASFAGTAGYVRLATIYDNTGNGHHITQPVAANQYIIVPGIRVPYTNALALINDSENFGPLVEKFMIIPASLLVAAGGAISGFAVCNLRNYNQQVTPLSLTGSDGQNFSVTFAGGIVADNGNTGSSIVAPKPAPINGIVAGFSGAPSNSYVCEEDNIGVFGTNGGVSIAGGFLGSLNGVQGGCHEVCGIVVYGTQVQPIADTQTLISNLEKHFGLSPQIKDIGLLDGDSITYGYGTSFNQDYPHQMVPFLSHDFKIRNVAYFGETTGERLQEQPAILSSLTGDGSQNVYVIWAGTNDIDGGVPLATMQTNMLSLVANAKAAGYKVVAVTCLPREDFPTAPGTKETQRLAWNSWLLSGASGADTIADVAADPTMGNYANNAPGLYYIDGTHPTSLGHSFTAPIIAKAINSIVP